MASSKSATAKKMFVSTTVNIYTKPCTLSSLNRPAFIFLPSSSASASVSLLSLMSSLESFNSSSLLHSWSTARSATMENLFKDSSFPSGILIFISAVYTTSINHAYIKNFFSMSSPKHYAIWKRMELKSWNWVFYWLRWRQCCRQYTPILQPFAPHHHLPSPCILLLSHLLYQT